MNAEDFMHWFSLKRLRIDNCGTDCHKTKIIAQSRNVFRNDIVAIAATKSKVIAGRQSRNDQRSTAHNAQKCPFPSSWSHFLNCPLARLHGSTE